MYESLVYFDALATLFWDCSRNYMYVWNKYSEIDYLSRSSRVETKCSLPTPLENRRDLIKCMYEK